jgi:hypothetical protein
MQVDTSSYNIGQPAANPMDAFSRAFAQRQESQIRGQAIQQNDLQMKEAQRKIAEDEAYKQAIASSSGMTDTAFLEHIRTTAPGSFLSVQKAVDEAKSKAAATAEAVARARDAAAQAATHTQTYIGHLADQIDQSDYNPVVVNAALNMAVQQFPEWKQQADGLREIAATQGKDALKAALKPMIDAGTTKTRAETANTTAELPGKVATSAIQQQVAAGTVGGMTPEQQQQAKDRAANTAIAARNASTSAGQLSVSRGNLELAKRKFESTIGSGLDEQGRPLPPEEQVRRAQADPVAKMIAEYRTPALSARSMQTPGGQALMQRVAQLNPDYDASQFPARSKMRIAFTSGPQGQTLNSLNTAIEHLDQFVGFAKDMGNGSFQPTNELRNWVKTNFGDSAPTNFEGIKVIMAGELASAFKKSGATDQEIKSVEESIKSKSSASQLVDYATKVAIPALGGKAATFEAQWKQTMGAKDTTFSAYTPGAKAVLEKYGAGHSAAAPASGTVRARDPQGNLHEAKAGTPLPAGWKLEGG